MSETIKETKTKVDLTSSAARKFTQFATVLGAAGSFGAIAAISLPALPFLALGAAALGGGIGYLSLQLDKR
jgi:hypothetical protein